MSKLTKAKLELFWWKVLMIGFMLEGGMCFLRHWYLATFLLEMFGLVALEAVIESANRIQAIKRNQFNAY